MKYIIRSYTPFIEKKSNTLIGALQQKRKIEMNGSEYCHIIKIPFAKRHPDFPIWFSVFSLILVILSRVVN